MTHQGLSVPHKREKRGARFGTWGTEPFPEWGDLITPEMILAAQGIEKRPPRPSSLPVYGWTAAGRVMVLLDLSPRDWDRLDVRKVTGLVPDGWRGGWYPVEPEDRERVLAERQRLADARRPARGASSSSAYRRPPRVRRYRRSAT
jgi:hypothetical protein